LTRLNQSSDKAGFAGTLLMGLTFSLTSFACVGPFVGTLLAASVTGGAVRAVIGMMTFALGLSLPFFLLALFPSYLKKMPRSGGWMARVKVVMGFVILAASLKYLVSMDAVLQWGFLTRERVLAGWIVLFGMAGLYLLGFIRLEGIKAEDRMGVGRLLTGMALLAFAISLAPGMTGGALGLLDSYLPVATGGSGGASASGLQWMKNQYREALAKARAEGKLVFVNFTGYACANCHWMKANIFPRPEITSELQGMVLVELYGDGTDAASEENQKLELAMFRTVAQPLYVIMDPDEKVIATFEGKTSNAAEFLTFLQKRNVARPAAPIEAAAGIPQVKTLSGVDVNPKTYEGKVVVVNFWATWCVPCIQEIPGFNKLSKEYAAKGVSFLGVSMDEEGAEKVAPFLKKHPIDYTIGLGTDAVSTAYQLDELPVTLVFDKAGKQLKRFTGFTSEDALLGALKPAL
jgi:thiol:disulfide interchange protein DsbD